MPFKSRAQRRKFAELLMAGKISDETYEEWNRETGRKVLPERVKPKKGAARKTSGTRSAAQQSSGRRTRKTTQRRAAKKR